LTFTCLWEAIFCQPLKVRDNDALEDTSHCLDKGDDHLTLFQWFRRSEQPLGLRDVIANFSMERASQTFESTATTDRLASALSIATLFTAGQFSQGVLDHLFSLSKPATQPESSKLSLTSAYDVAVVEAAAFCYFHLLRPYVHDEDQPPQGGHLLRCLADP
jgi:hypothetical protein